MKKILVYHGKHGDVYWDATNKEKALWALFTMLDKEWSFYNHLNDVDEIEKVLKQKEDTLDRIERSVPPMNDVLNLGHIDAILKLSEEIVSYKGYVAQAKMLKNARAGEVASAIGLLNWRNKYQNESWEFEPVKEVE